MNNNFNNQINAQNSLIESCIAKINTALPVAIKSVNTKNKTVNVVSLIDKTDMQGNKITTPPLSNLPYLLLQAGSCGIICDPQVGDTGLVVFCSRDISNVKTTTIPASERKYSLSDGIYIGLLYGGKPKTFIELTDNNININASKITLTGEVIINNIVFDTHIHGNGNGGNTTPPKKG